MSSEIKKGVAICFCAEWCGTCRSYRETFQIAQAEISSFDFIWLDIEEHSSECEILDIEAFPAWLVVWEGQPKFWGTLLPHFDHLHRLLGSLNSDHSASFIEPRFSVYLDKVPALLQYATEIMSH